MFAASKQPDLTGRLPYCSKLKPVQDTVDRLL